MSADRRPLLSVAREDKEGQPSSLSPLSLSPAISSSSSPSSSSMLTGTIAADPHAPRVLSARQPMPTSFSFPAPATAAASVNSSKLMSMDRAVNAAALKLPSTVLGDDDVVVDDDVAPLTIRRYLDDAHHDDSNVDHTPSSLPAALFAVSSPVRACLRRSLFCSLQPRHWLVKVVYLSMLAGFIYVLYCSIFVRGFTRTDGSIISTNITRIVNLVLAVMCRATVGVWLVRALLDGRVDELWTHLTRVLQTVSLAELNSCPGASLRDARRWLRIVVGACVSASAIMSLSSMLVSFVHISSASSGGVKPAPPWTDSFVTQPMWLVYVSWTSYYVWRSSVAFVFLAVHGLHCMLMWWALRVLLHCHVVRGSLSLSQLFDAIQHYRVMVRWHNLFVRWPLTLIILSFTYEVASRLAEWMDGDSPRQVIIETIAYVLMEAGVGFALVMVPTALVNHVVDGLPALVQSERSPLTLPHEEAHQLLWFTTRVRALRPKLRCDVLHLPITGGLVIRLYYLLFAAGIYLINALIQRQQH